MTLKKILIIDDDEIDHFQCERTIKKVAPELEIKKAFDGREGLDLLKTDDIDLILLDVNMPGMNGFEFLDAYSREENARPTSVIMLSSSTYQKDKERAQQYPFVRDYFEKPLSADTMQKAMRLFE